MCITQEHRDAMLKAIDDMTQSYQQCERERNDALQRLAHLQALAPAMADLRATWEEWAQVYTTQRNANGPFDPQVIFCAGKIAGAVARVLTLYEAGMADHGKSPG